MQKVATKAILTACYDDDGPNVEEKAEKQYKKEVESGYYLPTHVFYRDLGRHIVTKFNFPMPLDWESDIWVPAINFPMLATSRNPLLEDIATVGDWVTGFNAERFKAYFKDKKVKFASEGEPEGWSFSNTLEKGAEVLKPEEGELVYVLMGDTLLKHYFDKVLRDPDIGKFDLIYNMNARRRTNKHWPRRFHWKLSHKGRHRMVKEAQDFLVDIPRMEELSEDLGLDEHIFDLLYASRKAHANKGESKEEKFKKVIFDNWGKFVRAAVTSPVYSWKLGRWYLSERDKPLPLSSRGIYKAVRFATGKRVLLKADNRDPATIEDIDGLADWANLSEMLIRAGDSIYPYYSELRKFGENTMPELRELDFYRDFKDYMNSVFKGYNLPEPFVANGNFRNPFTSNEIDEVTRERSERIIRKSIRRHKRHLRKIKVRSYVR